MKSLGSLIIGCANFSDKYGLDDNSKVPKEAIREIINKNQNIIKELDTAISYYNANNKLKDLDLKKLKISTKLPFLNFKEKDLETKVIKLVFNHSKKLNLDKFETIYLHDSNQLLGRKSNIILKTLEKLKKIKITKNVGVSIYNPEELEEILKIFVPDVVQFPLNIFDRRFLNKKTISLIKKNKIIPYSRSIFLQGLLLKDAKKLPLYFKRWKTLFFKYEKWIKQNKISKVEGCLSILNSLPIKMNLILGIKNNLQFKSIFKKLNTKVTAPKELFSNDRKLLNPYFWKI